MEQNLEELEFEELVQLHQEGKITWVQFVEANKESYDDWEEYLKDNNLEKTEEAARQYLSFCDERLFEENNL